MLCTCQKHEDIPASKVQVKTADREEQYGPKSACHKSHVD